MSHDYSHAGNIFSCSFDFTDFVNAHFCWSIYICIYIYIHIYLCLYTFEHQILYFSKFGTQPQLVEWRGYPEFATYLHDSMYDESNSTPFTRKIRWQVKRLRKRKTPSFHQKIINWGIEKTPSYPKQAIWLKDFGSHGLRPF